MKHESAGLHLAPDPRRRAAPQQSTRSQAGLSRDGHRTPPRRYARAVCPRRRCSLRCDCRRRIRDRWPPARAASYENRVYQVGIEDGRRWSRSSTAPGTLERCRDRRGTRIRARARRGRIAGRRTARHRRSKPVACTTGYPLCRCIPRRGGRAPELESADNLAWMGRLLARMHGVGARAPFQRTWRDRSPIPFVRARRVQCSLRGLLPNALHEPLSHTQSTRLAALIERASWRANRCTRIAPARRLPRRQCAVDRRRPAFRRSRRRAHAVRPYRTCGCLRRRRSALEALLEGYAEFRDFDPRELALIEPLRSCGRSIGPAGSAALARSGVPARIRLRRRSALVGAASERSRRSSRELSRTTETRSIRIDAAHIAATSATIAR